MRDPATSDAAAPAAEAPAPGGNGLPRRRRWLAALPLTAVWIAALLPVALYLSHRSDPELTVRIANGTSLWGRRAAWASLALLAIAALLFPPLPAWIRLVAHRTRMAWAVDRAPLLQAIAELRHVETPHRHLEVGRLAWQRADLGIAGPHLERAVELDPSMPAAQHLFGLWLLRAGAPGPAHAAFAAAEALDRGHAFGDALLHAGRCEDLLGAHERAVATLAAHEARHGGSRRSAFWHGEALQNAGRLGEARARFVAAAATPTGRLTAEENWFRARARVRLWRLPRGDA